MPRSVCLNTLDHCTIAQAFHALGGPLHMSHLMRLWYFSSSVNSFFKHAWAAIQWGRCLIFGRTLCLLSYFICANSEVSGETCGCAGSPEPSLVAYVISTIISLAGLYHIECGNHVKNNFLEVHKCAGLELTLMICLDQLHAPHVSCFEFTSFIHFDSFSSHFQFVHTCIIFFLFGLHFFFFFHVK